MTRAEDRLYVCGWKTAKNAAEGCWYELVNAALGGIAGCEEIELDLSAIAPGLSGAGLRLACPQRVPPKSDRRDSALEVAALADDWAEAPAAAEAPASQPLTPSDTGAEPPPESPAAAAADWFLRGRLIHGLLQYLPPQIDGAARAEAAARFLARPGLGLEADTRAEIAAETLAVLDDPGFAALFGPGSLAEVPVTGVVGGSVVSGQIDRLVIGDGEVLVVDYKTGRRCPSSAEAVAPQYVRQMALYRALLQRALPGRAVRCGLVFTAQPRLLALPDEALDAALAELLPPA